MRFEIVTLFPKYFGVSLRQSLLGKALEKRLFDIEINNHRDFAQGRHKSADDTPFGGGGGMVMKIEPLDRCLKSLGYNHRGQGDKPGEKERVILTSAAGKSFDQKTAIRYSLCDRLTIISGHYLGVDERILELYELDELSIGDYVLTGGEPATAVIVDAVARLLPGVLGNFESATEDSYMETILGAPCYTRPAEYENLRVPDVLMSGDHAQIRAFRRRWALDKCRRHRPDLLRKAELTDDERVRLGRADRDIEEE
jgi:tRNA (guanine37-N1)-methyltransferase